MSFLNDMVAQPGAAVFLALILWFVCFLETQFMLNALFRMHKSNTAVKKIRKQYKFWQKLTLRHVAEHTEHAVKFTRFMICAHYLSCGTILVCLLSRLILSDRWFVYLLAAHFLVFDVPVLFLGAVLDAYPFRRHKHEYRFVQYHNTSDKTSLF